LLTFWRSFRHLNQLLAHRLNTVVSSAYSKPDFFVQSRCRICSNWNAVTKLQCDKVSCLLDHFPNRYCKWIAMHLRPSLGPMIFLWKRNHHETTPDIRNIQGQIFRQ
jgi:hypothetical protein